ncbi:DUF4876 domain-containing protein [Balneolales bacterium ANBcel1]|nr:DUF4876 domain-containing protein [Balneolales bacterium ANBcel1]
MKLPGVCRPISTITILWRDLMSLLLIDPALDRPRSIVWSRRIPVMLLMILPAVFGCDDVVSQRDKPAQAERAGTTVLELVDESGVMETVYGRTLADSARVQLRSNTHGTEHLFWSDSEGRVEVTGLVSDRYFISVDRPLRRNEIERMPDLMHANSYSLANRSHPSVDIRGDSDGSVTIPLELVFGGAPIVFSEIYVSGPPGAGLYFFDRYIEFYNQTDSTLYLDGLVVARVYASSWLGLNFIDDPEFIHSTNVWKFPGSGTDYPIGPGQFVICAVDAIDHRINAPESHDMSGADFEFYKPDAPDIDNPNVPNMVMIYQDSGVDWLVGGQADAIVLARTDTQDLKWRDGRILIPYVDVIDGVEYLHNPANLSLKKLNPAIDAGAAGGISFYTGRSMERRPAENDGGTPQLQNTNNSSVDFRINERPTPGYHPDFTPRNSLVTNRDSTQDTN